MNQIRNLSLLSLVILLNPSYSVAMKNEDARSNAIQQAYNQLREGNRGIDDANVQTLSEDIDFTAKVIGEDLWAAMGKTIEHVRSLKRDIDNDSVDAEILTTSGAVLTTTITRESKNGYDLITLDLGLGNNNNNHESSSSPTHDQYQDAEDNETHTTTTTTLVLSGSTPPITQLSLDDNNAYASTSSTSSNYYDVLANADSTLTPESTNTQSLDVEYFFTGITPPAQQSQSIPSATASSNNQKHRRKSISKRMSPSTAKALTIATRILEEQKKKEADSNNTDNNQQKQTVRFAEPASSSSPSSSSTSGRQRRPSISARSNNNNNNNTDKEEVQKVLEDLHSGKSTFRLIAAEASDGRVFIPASSSDITPSLTAEQIVAALSGITTTATPSATSTASSSTSSSSDHTNSRLMEAELRLRAASRRDSSSTVSSDMIPSSSTGIPGIPHTRKSSSSNSNGVSLGSQLSAGVSVCLLAVVQTILATSK
jgi:hypothetical protein